MNIFSKGFFVEKNIKKYFSYLFEKGYSVKCYTFKHVGLTFWQVILEGPNCLILIFQDRSELFLSYVPKYALSFEDERFKVSEQFGLQGLISYVTKGEKVSGIFNDTLYGSIETQYEYLSFLVEEYHELICPLFDSNYFATHKDEMIFSVGQHNTFLIERYAIEHHPLETFSFDKCFLDLGEKEDSDQ